jgi:citrate lyase subunit beta-like protein
LDAPHLDTIVIPKVNSASELNFVNDVLRHKLPDRHSSSSTKPPIKLIALVESARSVMDLPSICKASPYLSGLVFAAEDFATDLSITRTPSLTEFLYARSAVVTAARAHNLPSVIDLVTTDFKSENWQKTLRHECEDGKRLGFNGKQLIHPTQVDICEEVFSPAEKEIEWAVRMEIANKKAVESRRGAWSLDSKMIDKPVIIKAESIIKRAEMAGIDLQGLREEWKDQEPY